MPIRSLACTWLLLTLVHKSVSMTTCEAPPVRAGEEGTVTCQLSDDLNQFPKVVAVHKYDERDQFEEILNCAWTADSYKCDTAPGYSFDDQITNTLTLKILSATEGNVGRYVCQILPADPDGSSPCTFTLTDSDVTSTHPLTSARGNNITETNDTNTTRVPQKTSARGRLTAAAKETTRTTVGPPMPREKEGITQESTPLLAILLPICFAVAVAVAVAVLCIFRQKFRKCTRKSRTSSDPAMREIDSMRQRDQINTLQMDDQLTRLLVETVDETKHGPAQQPGYIPEDITPETGYLQTPLLEENDVKESDLERYPDHREIHANVPTRENVIYEEKPTIEMHTKNGPTQNMAMDRERPDNGTHTKTSPVQVVTDEDLPNAEIHTKSNTRKGVIDEEQPMPDISTNNGLAQHEVMNWEQSGTERHTSNGTTLNETDEEKPSTELTIKNNLTERMKGTGQTDTEMDNGSAQTVSDEDQLSSGIDTTTLTAMNDEQPVPSLSDAVGDNPSQPCIQIISSVTEPSDHLAICPDQTAHTQQERSTDEQQSAGPPRLAHENTKTHKNPTQQRIHDETSAVESPPASLEPEHKPGEFIQNGSRLGQDYALAQPSDNNPQEQMDLTTEQPISEGPASEPGQSMTQTEPAPGQDRVIDFTLTQASVGVGHKSEEHSDLTTEPPVLKKPALESEVKPGEVLQNDPAPEQHSLNDNALTQIPGETDHKPLEKQAGLTAVQTMLNRAASGSETEGNLDEPGGQSHPTEVAQPEGQLHATEVDKDHSLHEPSDTAPRKNFHFTETPTEQQPSDFPSETVVKPTRRSFKEGHLKEELFTASWANDTDKIRELVQNGADVNSRGYGGETPLHVACRGGFDAMLQILLDGGADAEAKDLLGLTPLHWACKYGKQSIVNKLIARGASVTAKGEDDATPLHLVCQNGLAAVLEILLNAGADIEARDKDGFTPLHWACKYGKAAAIRTLLDHGADVNAKGKGGASPFHVACQNGQEAVLNILVDHGYDCDAKDEKGMTALRWACEHDREVLTRAIVAKGADVNARGEDGFTALHVACKLGKEALVNILLSGGSDTEAKDKTDLTPLHWACKNTQHDTVETLLSHGSNVNAKDHNSWTPLHFACQRGSKEIVQMLCQSGAEIRAKTNDKLKPKHIAKRLAHKEIVKMLKKASKDKHPAQKRLRTD